MSETSDQHARLEKAARLLDNYRYHRDQQRVAVDGMRELAVELGMDQREAINGSPQTYLLGYLTATGYAK